VAPPVVTHAGNSAAGVRATGGHWQVAIEVENRSGTKANVTCVVAVEQGDRTGAAEVGIGVMKPGAIVERIVTVHGSGAPAPSVPVAMAVCGPRAQDG
jgi:hypothetical protein